jgi:hypothetical protein
MLDQDDIEACRRNDPVEIARTLFAAAMARRGSDNLSINVADYCDSLRQLYSGEHRAKRTGKLKTGRQAEAASILGRLKAPASARRRAQRAGTVLGGGGPIVEIVPPPSGGQFLNVIESVFSPAGRVRG